MGARSPNQRARPVLVHRVPRVHRAGAVLLAWIFLVGNVGSFIHAATERHARCPEHGHLIHVDDGATDSAAEAALAARTVIVSVDPAGPRFAGAAPAFVATTSPDGAEHEHEHCHLCPASRKWTLHAAGSVAHVPHTAVVRWHALDTEARLASSTLYAIAPKTSPPV